MAVLVATLLSFAVARTVTRPIRALTATMREMAATGVLTSTPEAPTPTPWDDEDARLLTGTFHSLTVSLDRFQREAAQRERLSSLGRLSTVIAHEIRNPLMIIKGSLRSLRRGVATPEEVAGVAADIEGEVTRLNRVVNDVLDYAKPIALTYDAVEIDRLVRDAAQAVVASQAGPPDVVVEAAEGVTGTTDGDRLRQVVINLVTNARDAVLAQRAEGVAPASADDAGAPIRVPPPVHVRARLLDDDHVEIAVADRGVGMSDVEVARMFEPFFTTKRRGSGIGLAIAKNIVDGLGGRIDVDSQPGAGTTIRLTRVPPARSPARHRSSGFGAAGLTRFAQMLMTPLRSPGSVLIVDDEAKIRQLLAKALAEEGHDVVAIDSARAARAAPRHAHLRRAAGRQPDARGHRARPDPRHHVDDAGERAAADPDDDGARDGRERAGGDEAGRARLPAEAVRDRRAASWSSSARSSTSACAASTATCSPSATRTSTTTASSAAAS